jgi:hypothetical protein
MDTPKIIQVVDDAILIMELAESEEETLNEVRVTAIIYMHNGGLSGISQIALNINKSHLAFSMDSGVVGVVDLSTKTISRMKTKHESVCTIFGLQSQIPLKVYTDLRFGQVHSRSAT